MAAVLNFNIGDIIYPIKQSPSYQMTQLNKVIKAEVIEINGKIAKVLLISIKESIHPNKDGSPINSLLSSHFSIDVNIKINEGEEINVFITDFYKKKESIFCEFGKYPAIYYLQIIQNSLK